MRFYLRLIVGSLRRALRPRQDPLIESLVLRQQLKVCVRQSRRRQSRPEGRLFWSIVARAWTPWRSHLQLVQLDHRHPRAPLGLAHSPTCTADAIPSGTHPLRPNRWLISALPRPTPLYSQGTAHASNHALPR